VDLGIAYLEIALRLRRLAPWLVESYTGPSELVARIDAEPPLPAGELREQVRALSEAIDEHDLEADRRVWLGAQLAALDTALGALAGEPLGYRELVERCHGVTPTFVPESAFADAHDRVREEQLTTADLLPA